MKKLILSILLITATRAYAGIQIQQGDSPTFGTTTSTNVVITSTAGITFSDNSTLITASGISSTSTFTTFQTAVNASTNSLQTSVNTLGVSTASLQTQLNNVGVSTGSLLTTTNNLTTSTTTLQTSVNNLGASTGTLQGTINTLTTSTTTLSASTTTLQTSVNNLTTSTNTLSAKFPVSLSSNTVGVLPASQMVSTAAFTTSTQTFTGAATFTSTNGVILSNNGANAPLNYPNAVLQVVASTNNYLQTNVQNYSQGNNASADTVLTSSLGGDTSYYLDIGINGSGYNQATYSAFPSSWAYIYSSDAGLSLWAGVNGTQTASRITFGSSNPVASNIWMDVTSSGTVDHYGNVNVSSGLLLSTQAGSNGQVLTSGGAGTVPTWTTPIALASSQTWTGAQQFSTMSITNSNPTTKYLMAIGTSTPTGPYVVDVSTTCHFNVSSSSLPTLSSCGTTPSVVGNDNAGRITEGTGGTTTCTVTFAYPFTNTPFCVAQTTSTATTGAISAVSNTSFTITTSASLVSDTLNYMCIGKD